MAEIIVKKRNLIFITKTVLLLSVLFCILHFGEGKVRRKWEKSKSRNGRPMKQIRRGNYYNYNPAVYQQRSSYCLQLNPGSGLDQTATWRFHRETEQCYRVGERGPCGEMMVFTIEDATYGTCDCDQSLRCGRPLIYWPPKNRCYYAFDQGPCREGKWLVFGFDLHPVCRRNPCVAQELASPSFGNHYWFSHKGKCYKTYSQGYCAKNEILFNMKTHFRPICVKHAECVLGIKKGGSKFGLVQYLQCLPGQKLDFYGKCKREYQALTPLQNTTGLGIAVTSRPINLYCLFCKTN